MEQAELRYNLPVLHSAKRIGFSLSVTAGFNWELAAKVTISVIDIVMLPATKERGAVAS